MRVQELSKLLGRGQADADGAAAWAVLLPWHKLVLGRWGVQWQECNGVCKRSRSCGEDIAKVCALELHLRHRRRDRRVSMSMWDAKTAEGTGGWTKAQVSIGGDQGLIREWKGLRQKKSHGRPVALTGKERQNMFAVLSGGGS